MKIVSYWKDHREVYRDTGLTLIVGRYDHKNKQNGGEKALGVHWGDYPTSRGVLSPCVIPERTRNAILAGLLHQAVIDGSEEQIKSLTEAIAHFK